MVGEAEVVVGAEVQDVAADGADVGLLGGGEHALGFVESRVADLLELAGEVFLEAVVCGHGMVPSNG